MLLTAGCPAPVVGAPVHRDEGVALVLNCPGLGAQKCGERQWTAWHSRYLSACLESGGDFGKLHAISCLHQLEMLE